MKRIGLLLMSLAVSTTLACNRANDNRSDIAANNNNTAVGTAGDAANTLSGGDRNFIEDELEGGMAEIELGKMAGERAASAEVKRFAQMMVADHTRAGDELKQIASRYGIIPPATLNDKHRDLRDKLSKLQGADFDREYMSAMVDDHQEDVNHLESRVDKKGSETTGTSGQANQHAAVTPEHSDNAATMAVNQWAANTLPTVEKHLDHAKSTHDELGKRGRNATR